MKQRIITSVVGVAVVLVWLALRETVVFNIMISLVLLLAMHEVMIATKIVKSVPLFLAGAVYAVIVPFFPVFGIYPVGVIITALYVMALIIIMLWQHGKVSLLRVSYTFMVSTLIPYAVTSLAYINSLDYIDGGGLCVYEGIFYLLLALSGAWIADTGAYFTGKFLGKHKLAPHISPKKTVEGSVGGVLAVVIFYIAVALVWQFAFLRNGMHINYFALIFMAVCVSICGMIGDLTFSCIKREVKIKDFGKIMPGHGGILDRIDSLVLTAPCIMFFVAFMPIITVL